MQYGSRTHAHISKPKPCIFIHVSQFMKITFLFQGSKMTSYQFYPSRTLLHPRQYFSQRRHYLLDPYPSPQIHSFKAHLATSKRLMRLETLNNIFIRKGGCTLELKFGSFQSLFWYILGRGPEPIELRQSCSKVGLVLIPDFGYLSFFFLLQGI